MLPLVSLRQANYTPYNNVSQVNNLVGMFATRFRAATKHSQGHG